MSVHTKRIDYPDGGWCEQEYRDETLHGRWIVYYPNGRIKWERVLVDGLKHGPQRSYDEAGNLTEEQIFVGDELHGTWRRAAPDGTLQLVGEFKCGYPIEALENPRNPEFIEFILPHIEIDSGDSDLAEVTRRLRRSTVNVRAGAEVGMPIGHQSYAGAVTVMGSKESWPTKDGIPLSPILQIACADVPIDSQPWKDFTFITLFAVPDDVPTDLGSDLVVRSYRKSDTLVAVTPPPTARSVIDPCALDFSPPALSFPDDNDLSPALRRALEGDSEASAFQESDTRMGTRLSGWPTWIQSGRLVDFGTFAFQVDSLMFPGWECGDCTIHYFFLSETAEFEWIAEMT